MIRSIKLLVWGLLGFSGAAISQSQSETETGSRIGHPKPAYIEEGRATPEAARVTLAEFARCEVDQDTQRVRLAISFAAGYDEPALRAAATENCLRDGTLTIPTVLYRGALFAELYRRHERLKSSAAWSFPIIPLDRAVPPLQSSPWAARANYVLMGLAECVYEQKPEAVRAVVLAQTGSKEEEAAIAGVVPLLSPCISAGQTVKLNKATIEVGFAEYLYRSLGVLPDTQAAKGQ